MSKNPNMTPEWEIDNTSVGITQRGFCTCSQATKTIPVTVSTESAFDDYPSNMYTETLSGKFGAVANTWTPISDTGTVALPTVAVLLDVVSDDADDTIAGAGAQKVRLVGFDENYAQISEEVEMDGLTPVTTANEYIRVTSIFLTQAGATTTNEGNISVSQTAVPATLFGKIINGTESSSRAFGGIRVIPDGYRAVVRSIDVQNGDKTAVVDARIRIMRGSVVFATRPIFVKDRYQTETIDPIGLNALDSIWVEGKTSTGTAPMACILEIQFYKEGVL